MKNGLSGYYYDNDLGLYYLQSRYYNPTLGRFLNADAFASTGQGLLGNNMFVYCLNNPVRLGDFTGEDAVVLYDEDFVGHIGVLVQDENGKWWHFYWGGWGLLGQLASVFGFDVIAESWCVEYTGDPTSLEEINNSGQYESYEEMHYLTGDFSETVETFKNMGSLYNLYDNNCSIVSLRTLSNADTSYQNMLTIASHFTVPAHANKFIRNNVKKQRPNEKFSPLGGNHVVSYL